jgi:hypothetical protein
MFTRPFSYLIMGIYSLISSSFYFFVGLNIYSTNTNFHMICNCFHVDLYLLLVVLTACRSDLIYYFASCLDRVGGV